MSKNGVADTVVSGRAYVVAAVDGETPELALVAADPVVTLTLWSSGEGLHDVHGCGRLDGDRAVFLEKDHAGVGCDVRTWDIGVHDGQLEAVVRSNY